MCVQTDSCINAGNSGGPVLNSKGKAVGIAFQSLAGGNAGAEGIGYIIPAAVVRHFLEDFTRNGRYSGFPALNITWQVRPERYRRQPCARCAARSRAATPRHPPPACGRRWSRPR